MTTMKAVPLLYGVILSLVFMGALATSVAADKAVNITHYNQITSENWDQSVYRGVAVADMVEAFDKGSRRGLLKLAKEHGMKYSDLRFYQMTGDTARSKRRTNLLKASAKRHAANADRHAASADRHAANADRLEREGIARKARIKQLRQQSKEIKERTDKKFRQGLEMLRD